MPTATPSIGPTISPTSLDPSITAIAGTYKTQARFGGANESVGNGGTWKMTISELGEIAFNDMPVDYEFDRATQFLSWNRQSDVGGATTNAEITFHSTLSAGYYFPNNEEDVFTGKFIINNGGGWLDFRGTLCTLDDWRDCRAPSRQPSESPTTSVGAINGDHFHSFNDFFFSFLAFLLYFVFHS